MSNIELLLLGDLAIGSAEKRLDITGFPTANNTLINLEGSILRENRRKPIRGFYNSLTTLYLLRQLNISHVNLLNNHTLDLGSSALAETEDTLRQMHLTVLNYADIKITTISEHVGVISIGSKLIGCPTGWINLEDDSLKKQLEIAIVQSGLKNLILYIHCGFEFEKHPEPWIRNKIKEIASIEEVSLITCLHSHVVKGYEVVSNCHVFYGLGNFYIENDVYFDGSLRYNESCDTGLAVGYSKDKIRTFHTIKSEESVRFIEIDFTRFLCNYGVIQDYYKFYQANRRKYRLMLMPPQMLRGNIGILYLYYMRMRGSLIKFLIPIKKYI